MLPNIKTCENRWLNFSENLRVKAIKLFELTLFLSPNLSIYFNFCTMLWSVVIEGDFRAQSIYREVYGVTQLPFIRLVDKIIQEQLATQGTSAVSPDRPPTIMEIYFKTEGLSKSDIATMVLDMFFAGVDTVATDLSYDFCRYFFIITVRMFFHEIKNSVHQTNCRELIVRCVSLVIIRIKIKMHSADIPLRSVHHVPVVKKPRETVQASGGSEPSHERLGRRPS